MHTNIYFLNTSYFSNPCIGFLKKINLSAFFPLQKLSFLGFPKAFEPLNKRCFKIRFPHPAPSPKLVFLIIRLT